MSISARATSVPRRAAMPKARCTSALLTTMSTLPPISPASSVTERSLVRSSGTSVTCGSAVMSSMPGNFFHGSAWPTHTMSAPAFTSACTIAWPTAVLPSVTSTLRNFGSLVISRSILSSAMCSPPSAGNPISTAWPARSSRAPTRTGAGASPTSPCRCTSTDGPTASCTRPSRQGRRSRKNMSLLWCSVVWPSKTPSPDCARHLQVRRQAAVAGIARRVLHGTAVLAHLQLEAALRRGGRHAQRHPAARPRRQVHLRRAQDRVLALGLHQRHGHDAAPRYHGAGAQASVVGDHAEARDQAELRARHGALAGGCR